MSFRSKEKGKCRGRDNLQASKSLLEREAKAPEESILHGWRKKKGKARGRNCKKKGSRIDWRERGGGEELQKLGGGSTPKTRRRCQKKCPARLSIRLKPWDGHWRKRSPAKSFVRFL